MAEEGPPRVVQPPAEVAKPPAGGGLELVEAAVSFADLGTPPGQTEAPPAEPAPTPAGATAAETAPKAGEAPAVTVTYLDEPVADRDAAMAMAEAKGLCFDQKSRANVQAEIDLLFPPEAAVAEKPAPVGEPAPPLVAAAIPAEAPAAEIPLKKLLDEAQARGQTAVEIPVWARDLPAGGEPPPGVSEAELAALRLKLQEAGLGQAVRLEPPAAEPVVPDRSAYNFLTGPELKITIDPGAQVDPIMEALKAKGWRDNEINRGKIAGAIEEAKRLVAEKAIAEVSPLTPDEELNKLYETPEADRDAAWTARADQLYAEQARLQSEQIQLAEKEKADRYATYEASPNLSASELVPLKPGEAADKVLAVADANADLALTLIRDESAKIDRLIAQRASGKRVPPNLETYYRKWWKFLEKSQGVRNAEQGFKEATKAKGDWEATRRGMFKAAGITVAESQPVGRGEKQFSALSRETTYGHYLEMQKLLDSGETDFEKYKDHVAASGLDHAETADSVRDHLDHVFTTDESYRVYTAFEWENFPEDQRIFERFKDPDTGQAVRITGRQSIKSQTDTAIAQHTEAKNIQALAARLDWKQKLNLQTAKGQERFVRELLGISELVEVQEELGRIALYIEGFDASKQPIAEAYKPKHDAVAAGKAQVIRQAREQADAEAGFELYKNRGLFKIPGVGRIVESVLRGESNKAGQARRDAESVLIRYISPKNRLAGCAELADILDRAETGSVDFLSLSRKDRSRYVLARTLLGQSMNADLVRLDQPNPKVQAPKTKVTVAAPAAEPTHPPADKGAEAEARKKAADEAEKLRLAAEVKAKAEAEAAARKKAADEAEKLRLAAEVKAKADAEAAKKAVPVKTEYSPEELTKLNRTELGAIAGRLTGEARTKFVKGVLQQRPEMIVQLMQDKSLTTTELVQSIGIPLENVPDDVRQRVEANTGRFVDQLQAYIDNKKGSYDPKNLAKFINASLEDLLRSVPGLTREQALGELARRADEKSRDPKNKGNAGKYMSMLAGIGLVGLTMTSSPSAEDH